MFGFYHLFHRLKRPGKISLFLAILACFQYFFFNNSAPFTTEVQLLHTENRNSEYVGKLYLEYCIRRVVDRKKCLFTKPFFKLKRKKQEIENSDKNFHVILNDMGVLYKQSEHFLSFYKKLSKL